MWAHITLTRDISKVKVAHKDNSLMIPLARPMVLGPQECVMVIPPFRLEGLRVQFVASVCQIL